jgi:glycosyltransferase involved in cell wall biosynthesis
MKIVHATPYFAPAFVYGGPPRSVLGLCRALTRHGVDVAVVTTNANGDRDLAVPTDTVTTVDGIRVRYLARGWPRRYFGVRNAAAALDEMLRGVDLVHLHGCWNALTWRTAFACRRARIPYIVSPRGMLTRWSLEHSGLKKKIALQLVERRVLAAADTIHATSDDERRAIEEVGVSRPVVVVPNGIDVDSLVASPALAGSFRTAFAPNASDVVVLYLGRVHAKKGIETLAEAMRLVRRRTPSVRLVIAGHGEARYAAQLRTRFADLIGDGALMFTGLLEGDDRAAAFAAADMFALTSHSENFGLSVGEAMAAGLPVVVTRECPWPQIETWNAGRWVENAPGAVADAIDTLARDAELRQRLGANGRRGVETHLAWDAIAPQMASVYARSLERTRATLNPVTLRA